MSEDPRQVLVEAIIASRTPEQLYDYISREIVDEDGAISFYYFDVAMSLLKAFYEKSKFPEGEMDEIDVHMPGSKKSLN